MHDSVCVVEGGGVIFRSDRLSAGQTYDFVPELPVQTNLGEPQSFKGMELYMEL